MPAPASTAWSFSATSPFSRGSLGGGGLRRPGIGGLGILIAIYLAGHRGDRETLRIQVLPQPVDRLPRVARGEALQVGVDAVAWPDLDLPVLHPGLESVQRPHRRAALDLAPGVIDATV